MKLVDGRSGGDGITEIEAIGQMIDWSEHRAIPEAVVRPWFFGDQFLSPEAITGRGNGHALFRIDLYLMAAILSPRRTRSSVSCVPASVRDKGLWGPSKSVCF